MNTRIMTRLSVFVVAGALVAGCATQQGTNTAVGTGVGAGTGAALGAIFGGGKGAAIGAGAGTPVDNSASKMWNSRGMSCPPLAAAPCGGRRSTSSAAPAHTK